MTDPLAFLALALLTWGGLLGLMRAIGAVRSE